MYIRTENAELNQCRPRSDECVPHVVQMERHDDSTGLGATNKSHTTRWKPFYQTRQHIAIGRQYLRLRIFQGCRTYVYPAMHVRQRLRVPGYPWPVWSGAKEKLCEASPELHTVSRSTCSSLATICGDIRLANRSCIAPQCPIKTSLYLRRYPPAPQHFTARNHGCLIYVLSGRYTDDTSIGRK